MGVIHCFRNTGSSGLPLTILNKSKGPTCDSDIMNDSNKASPGMFLWSGVRFLSGAQTELSVVTWARGHIPIQTERHGLPRRHCLQHSVPLSPCTELWQHNKKMHWQKIPTEPDRILCNTTAKAQKSIWLVWSYFLKKSPTFKLKSNEVCGI